MDKPLVSICIPTRDRAAMLRQSLATICAQDYSPLEILIGDDASTDGTEALCRGLAERDPRIRYVRHPRALGLYGNHNWCIKESLGEFLCLFHDDDLHHPQLICESVAFLLNHPEVGVVCSDWEILDDTGNCIGVRDHDVPEVMSGLEYIGRTMRSGQSCIGIPGAVIRRTALGSLRLRADGPVGFADFVVWCQLAEGAYIGHIRKRLWSYRIHRRALSRSTIGSFGRSGSESLCRDYYENMNHYCDEHLQRFPEHHSLVAGWRRDINRYLFWALAYELGLHFRNLKDGRAGVERHDRSVFEIRPYTLTPDEVQIVRKDMRRFCASPFQTLALAAIELLIRLRMTWPLARMTSYATTVRQGLGLK